jgi:hypothetical protein
MRYSTAICILAWSWGVANAADITVEPAPSRPGLTVVSVKGRIEPADDEKFKTATAQLGGSVIVALASKGGNLRASINMGRAVRMRGWSTMVAAGDICASACADIWLGGITRFAWPKSHVGFHAAYNTNDGHAEVSGAGNAILGAYLSELGLGQDAIYYITFTDPKSMKWLNAADAAKLGIRVQMMKDDDVPFPMPAPVQAPPTAVEAKQNAAVPKETPNNPGTQSTAPVPTPTPAPKRNLWTLSMYATVRGFGFPREGTLRSVDLQDFDSREACHKARVVVRKKMWEQLPAHPVAVPRTRCLEKRQ